MRRIDGNYNKSYTPLILTDSWMVSQWPGGVYQLKMLHPHTQGTVQSHLITTLKLVATLAVTAIGAPLKVFIIQIKFILHFSRT